MKQSTHQFHKIFFHISKFLACNVEENITVEDNKKRMNIYMTKMTQNKNDSINSCYWQ